MEQQWTAGTRSDMQPWILHEAEVRSLYTTFDRAGKDPVQMSIGGMIRAAATVVHPACILNKLKNNT